MLIQLIAQHPSAIGTVLKNTPLWVWGLFAALAALGLSQARTRSVSIVRMAVMPVAMAGFSLWGTLSAFGNSPLFAWVLAAWLACAALMAALIGSRQAPAGTRHDAASGRFTVPGSLVPLGLILGIFLVKYIVGVDLRMQPALAADGQYTLITGALYGLFTGTFAGRSIRLWLLALRRGTPDSTASSTPVLNA